MIAGLFLLMLVTLVFAWIGMHRSAIGLFVVTLVLASCLFSFHMTTHLNIQL